MQFDVLVAGSLHLDIMVSADRLPALDETLMGSAWGFKTGGKGGNQAVAARQAGARVGMVGAVGLDDFGKRLLDALDAADVDRQYVEVKAAGASGMSVAIMDRHGEYAAVVVSGVNRSLIPPQSLPDAAVLLLQNEIAESFNVAVAVKAKTSGAKIVLNAAPARLLGEDFARHIDLLIVNRVEAGMLGAASIVSVDDALSVMPRLAAPGTDVIITLGADGFVLRENGRPARHVPAQAVEVVSTHGAGDMFCGTLAARLAAGADLSDAAMDAGNAASQFVSRA